MRSLSVNNQNDLYLDASGNLAISEGLAACMENCAQAVRALLSEMVLAMDEGTPFFQTIWAGGRPYIPAFEVSVRERILGVPGVTGVRSLSSELRGSTLHYTATVSTIYGVGVSNGGFEISN